MRLRLKLGVKKGAQQNDEGRKPKPCQQHDHTAKGARFGDARVELTRLVAMLAGTSLPAPVEDVA